MIKHTIQPDNSVLSFGTTPHINNGVDFEYKYLCPECGAAHLIEFPYVGTYRVTSFGRCDGCNRRISFLDTSGHSLIASNYSIESIHDSESLITGLAQAFNMSLISMMQYYTDTGQNFRNALILSWDNYLDSLISSNLFRNPSTLDTFMEALELKRARIFDAEYKTNYSFNTTFVKRQAYTRHVFGLHSFDFVVCRAEDYDNIKQGFVSLSNSPLKITVPIELFDADFLNVITNKEVAKEQTEDARNSLNSQIHRLKKNLVACHNCGYITKRDKQPNVCTNCKVEK